MCGCSRSKAGLRHCRGISFLFGVQSCRPWLESPVKGLQRPLEGSGKRFGFGRRDRCSSEFTLGFKV